MRRPPEDREKKTLTAFRTTIVMMLMVKTSSSTRAETLTSYSQGTPMTIPMTMRNQMIITVMILTIIKGATSKVS